MADNHVYPEFERAMLRPRYWLTWLGLGVLYAVVLLPYPCLHKLGKGLGRLAMRFMKRRVKIAHRNLELCFPDMPEQERREWVEKNFESVGMGVLETGMAWFWPDWRIERWCRVEGYDNMIAARKDGKGVLLIGLHFLTLELGARIFGMKNPGVGVYRPNDNKVMDWIQTWGRLRSNKYMLDRKDVKGMIRALKQGEIIWYAPDHDYGPKSSVFVPLFAVEQAATTTGTYILARMSKPSIVPFTPVRMADDSGYVLYIQPMLEGFPLDDEVAAAAYMNKVVEKEIMLAPTQYMWLHRRFKTRPEGVPSRY
ncbi:Kdo(2)-lipid IV(A) acyltransferase [Enterobacillus tribolii]|uniref:Lipid A biosynthesis acyltransferase n=1 Tax=Enterobacillus tribolii TaxID=1487935 RepID=A0A370R1H6_9GAMM|nr:Kdo(2)-lipid IV(A) acyltransferase [Enterobacillus tribolii]MBW7982684.1 LpxL/LpxP family Kdo(2)-lipid IV(A) lauroyl/palmitoleoyl acyltransferase [Enterobacillus tribolii]RDK95755.1 KDO2-lipid IV(A) lauroyltransferase [Enterobacillus tribolii]